jgi:hypothetical protein
MTDSLVQHADNAYEAVRALNHATIGGRAVPAPTVYALLGNLQSAGGYGLAQLLGQMADGLIRSLSEYDVYDHKREPAESVAVANKAMRVAAEHARQVGELLSAAQIAINDQGYNVPEDRRAAT